MTETRAYFAKCRESAAYACRRVSATKTCLDMLRLWCNNSTASAPPRVGWRLPSKNVGHTPYPTNGRTRKLSYMGMQSRRIGTRRDWCKSTRLGAQGSQPLSTCLHSLTWAGQDASGPYPSHQASMTPADSEKIGSGGDFFASHNGRIVRRA